MSDYPGITKAAQLIAVDNGGINRFRSPDLQNAEFEAWLSKQPSEPLPAINTWLLSLTDEQLETVCIGCSDEPETKALIAQSPPFTDDLLTRYFDEVC
jgi:hypothetical protein